MPLQNHSPQIDDRRFDDIMEEIRTRIARYSPEWQPEPVWSDLNHSDPGITLAQVFAWLSEMMIYRMNRVPDLHYIKFLKLLNIELEAAQSAQALVYFPVSERHTTSYILVPKLSQISAQSDEGKPIIFETDELLNAIKPKLTTVLMSDGYSYSNQTNANENAEDGFLPFGSLAKAGSSLLLGFESAADFPSRIQFSLFVELNHEKSDSNWVGCHSPAARYAPASIDWQYWNGGSWSALTTVVDETAAFTDTGFIRFVAPSAGSMQKDIKGDVSTSMYWLRAFLRSENYERPPQLLSIRSNTVRVTQAETLRDELLGGSNGRPSQSFFLGSTPVLAKSLVLEIDEGDGFTVWDEIDDINVAQSKEQAYALNRTTGEIRFGDGRHGGIPVAHLRNPANVVARRYRIGGGRAGNVAAGTIRNLVRRLPGVDEAHITNLRPAVGGRDEESLSEACLRAPQFLKSSSRAVTVEDFEYHARQAGNVKRAKALPLSHPNFPGIPIPGVITVIVVPDAETDLSNPAYNPKPMPSSATLRMVCEHLNKLRLLTTEIYVIRPSYKEVQIGVNLIARDDANVVEVQANVETALLRYFHPLIGGDDGQGWIFGGNIFYSKVYQHILNVRGVERIEELKIFLDEVETEYCRDVTIPDGYLVYSSEHTIIVNYSREQ